MGRMVDVYLRLAWMPAALSSALMSLPLAAADSPVGEGIEARGVLEFRIGPDSASVDLAEAWPQNLLQRVEQELAAADGMIRLAVSPVTITALKRDHDWMEITLDAERESEVAKFAYRVSYRRVFIPLSGEYAQGVTTFFLGSDQYGHGPMRRSVKPDALVELLKPHVGPD